MTLGDEVKAALLANGRREDHGAFAGPGRRIMIRTPLVPAVARGTRLCGCREGVELRPIIF